MNNPLTHIDLYGLISQDGGSMFSTMRNFWDGMKDVALGTLKLPGLAVEAIGYHLVPIPYVKDAIEFAGHCLAGKNPSAYTPSWNREKSQTVKHEGYGDGDPHYRHIIFNGVCCSLNDMMDRCAAKSKECGGVTVYGIYNSTNGIVMDLLEVMCQKLGILTEMQATAQREVQKIVDEMGEYRHHATLIVEAHSQGCETVHNLSSGLKKMMWLTAVGPARIGQRHEFQHVTNLMSPCDIVPYVADPLGMICSSFRRNIDFVKTQGCPLQAHNRDGKTYLNYLRAVGNEFKRMYGSVECCAY